jgi:hypothetical protein
VTFADRLLLACAVLCGLTPMELCAEEAPPPADTSFAYSYSHSVKPLPDSVIAHLVSANGSSSEEFDPFDAPHDPAMDLPASRPQTLSRSSVCSAVASVARANDLPVPFFANLIWQESGFNPRSISPAGAQGIAQFMPTTAKEYGLANPFDPIHAIHAAGRFLNKLVAQFGNLGLAAAAYNAGPGRVNDFMTKRRRLPDETKNYVVRVTGRPAEKWVSRAFVQGPEARLLPAKAPCIEVAQEVAAEVKIVQLARIAAAAEAAVAKKAAIALAANASAAKSGTKTAALKAEVRTALVAVKGKVLAAKNTVVAAKSVVVAALATKRAQAAPMKIADRIAPEKSSDRVAQAVLPKGSKTLPANKTPANKTVIAKAAPKSTPARTMGRTRVASAR